MSVYAGPEIVNEGLVLCLDAGNTKSYPGSGTTWFDLSGNGNNGTLTNGPTFSSDNGGSLVFDGTNDYFSTDLTIGDANESFTFGGFAKINSSTNSNFFLFGNYTVTGTTPFFAIAFNNSGTNTFIYIRSSTGSQLLGTNTSLFLNTWYYFIAVRDAATNQIKLYINGNLVATNTFSGSAIVKSEVNNFGGVRHLTNYINCNVGKVEVYNKALTTEEIQHNFNALRGRFGI